MSINVLCKRLCISFLLFTTSFKSFAVTEIEFWHSMESELGSEVNSLAERFNQQHPQYKVVPVYKGNYEQALASGIAATRSGNPPALLQVYEVGTALMMASSMIKPVWQVLAENGLDMQEQTMFAPIKSYYSDEKSGHLIAYPFNSSTPILYYNKQAFKQVGLNPEQPPATWQELERYAELLKKNGSSCSFASGWQGWINLEEFSAWHGLPFASENNGFSGSDARLIFNGPVQVRHIQQLQRMSQNGTFSYIGRKDEPTKKFYTGGKDGCAMIMASSVSFADIQHYARFDVGTGRMPTDETVKTAPQNAIIGGASLWVMKGKTPEVYKGVAEFIDFLAKPEIVAEWHQKTGYLPTTLAGYELSKTQGFYQTQPGREIAVQQLSNKPPLPFTKGLRLGYLPQIRMIIDEELESVWSGKKNPQQALDTEVERGNKLLIRFQRTNSSSPK